jgi:hypothetical protein
MAQPLPDEPRHEERVVPRIPLPQPARLVCQSVHPLEPDALHPVRRLRHEAGVEVERGADTDEHRRFQTIPHRGHPLLLLGHADPDPDDVGLGLVDLLDDRALLLVGERAVGRGVAADDLHARVLAAQVQCELDERALVAPAVEEDPRAGEGRALAVALHQLGSVDARGEVVAERVHRPDQRLAVRNRQVGVHDGIAQLGVLLADHDGVHGRDADVAALLGRDRRVHPVHRALVVGQRQRDAQHLDGGGRRHSSFHALEGVGVVHRRWGAVRGHDRKAAHSSPSPAREAMDETGRRGRSRALASMLAPLS